MKKLVTTMFLICAAMLLFSPQAGFAYPTWTNGTQGGCNNCHPTAAGTGLHTKDGASHQLCSNCHPNGVPGKNVVPSACIVCHPTSGPGLCQLIDAQAAHGATCLTSACHGPTCAPPATTTTVPANTTTTTPSETTTTTPSETTTTTAPAGCIITIDPAEIKVDGTNDVTEDVKVTIDAGSLTAADLQGLEVSFSDACSQYITVNTVNSAISNGKGEATANITVKGNAATSECKLTAKNTSGTIDCETTFTITKTANTTTTTIPTECQIKSISPSSVRIGLGIIPRIKRITITMNVDLESLGITCADLNIQNAPKGISIISCAVAGDSIEATILFWGVKPGTYNLNLDPCGSIPFVVKRF